MLKEDIYMNQVEEIFVLENELERLREKINKGILKNISHTSKEEYKNLLVMSRKLDDVIVNYIKIYYKYS